MNRPPPLQNLRILAVSQFGAGPFGTQFLADLGAEIIKIEDPAVGGDVARHVGPYAADGDSLYFQSFNRGTRSITLDLKHPQGFAVLRDLARVSHAVYIEAEWDPRDPLGEMEFVGRMRKDAGIPTVAVAQAWLDRDESPGTCFALRLPATTRER